MSSNNKIAIAGFTGKLARLMTAALLRNHPNVQIHGICRNPDKVSPSIRSHPNVKIFQATSADKNLLTTALAETSVCICCYLGDKTLMIDGQKTLIDACILAGVPRYIASDWSLDFRKLKLGDHPNKDPMKHITAYLEEKERDHTIKGVHILNGGFMEVVWAPFLGWVDTKADTFRYYGTGDEPIEMTTMRDAANFTAEVAVDPNANGFLNFLGDRKSVKEMARLYREAYHVEPQIQRMGSLEDLYNTMIPIFKEQPEKPFAWMGMFYQYYMGNGSTLLDKLDNDLYPSVVPTSVEAFLKIHSKDSVANGAFF